MRNRMQRTAFVLSFLFIMLGTVAESGFAGKALQMGNIWRAG